MRMREVPPLTVKEFFRQLFIGTDPGIFIVALLLLMVAVLICLPILTLESPKEYETTKVYNFLMEMKTKCWRV